MNRTAAKSTAMTTTPINRTASSETSVAARSVACLSAACLSTGCLACWLLCVTGCKPKTAAPVTKATVAAPAEKGQVELSNPKVTLVPPQLLKFEFDYVFVKGSPTKSYMCELTFPGTDNTGRKALEGWELKPSGVIKGAIELQSLDPPTLTYEIALGEADVPQNGYERISNVLTGEVVRASEAQSDAQVR